MQEPSGSSDQLFPVSVQFGVSQTYVCSVLCKHGQNRIDVILKKSIACSNLIEINMQLGGDPPHPPRPVPTHAHTHTQKLAVSAWGRPLPLPRLSFNLGGKKKKT